jgi:hypothetical protein
MCRDLDHRRMSVDKADARERVLRPMIDRPFLLANVHKLSTSLVVWLNGSTGGASRIQTSYIFPAPTKRSVTKITTAQRIAYRTCHLFLLPEQGVQSFLFETPSLSLFSAARTI